MRFLAVLLLCCSGIDAWGLRGHRIVARIAENHLAPEAKKMVETLLSGESLARIANDADHLRSDTAWSCAAVLHYASVEDGSSYAASVKNPQGDIVQALVYFENLLRSKDTTDEKRALALKWIVHLIGDLHQPLHIGRSCDRGGNMVELFWFDKKSNLHKVWDSDLINAEELSYTEYADFLDRGQYPATEIIVGSYADWADEAIAVRNALYTCYGKDGCCAAGKSCRDAESVFGACGKPEGFLPRLGYTYAEKNRALWERQLYRAGMRLASVLNSVARGEAAALRASPDDRKGKMNPVAQCVDAALRSR